jgi:RNA-directed DNA polymerase
VFEKAPQANSYGFRPGRSAHDAIEAIFNKIRYKPNYVLDADIEKCFDRINHEKLLDKLDTITPIKRLVRGWLKAGIMDHGEMLFPETGTPQGGVLSPLLANIALHGLEEAVTQGYKRSRNMAVLIRYADDFVILHHDRQVIEELRGRAETFLAEMGLRLKPSKTNTTHTLQAIDGKVGFDFLGFTIRQFPQGKHQSGRNTNGKLLGFKTIITPSKEAVARHLHDVKRLLIQHRYAPREVVIIKMTRLIKGWTRYFSTVSAREALEHAANQTFKKLMRWAQRRNKGSRRAMVDANFTQTWELKAGNRVLPRHTATPIERHIKVKGGKSPFDGDWAYWGARLGRSSLLPRQKAILLKKQGGRCSKCSLLFSTKDGMEVHHRDENRENRRWDNLTLLHRHCHDQVHRGANDNG